MVERTVRISFPFGDSDQEAIQVQVFWSLSRSKHVEPVKLSPNTWPKTKKVTQYILFFLVTTALIKGSELFGKKESRLKNIKQLTFSGENAEGYFSLDGNLLIYGTRWWFALWPNIYNGSLNQKKKTGFNWIGGNNLCLFWTSQMR